MIGRPDVVTVGSYGDTGVLLNNGAGGFDAPITSFFGFLYGALWNSAIVADLNGDGYADLIVGNSPNNSQPPVLAILINQKNGTFSKPIFLNSPEAAVTAYTFGAAKTTSSGHTDIVVAEEYGGEILLQTFVNNGSGSFTAKPMQVISTALQKGSGNHLAMVLADVNHDGKADLLLEKDWLNSSDENDYVFVMPGNGDGTFQLPTAAKTVTFPASQPDSLPYSTLVAQNLTSDTSKIDLLLNCQGGGIYEALSNGDGTYQTPKLLLNSVFTTQIFATDVNGDGKADLTTVGDGVLSTFLGNGDGTFSGIKGTALANGDEGSGSLSQTVFADFNQDGKIDFANGNTSGFVELSLGNGDGTFQSAPVYSTSSLLGVGPSIEAAPDLNSDGIPDIVAEVSDSLISGLSNGKGGFSFQTALPSSAYLGGFVLNTVGDFNGDGKQDVVMRTLNYGSDNTAAVALSIGNGTLKTPVFVIRPTTPLACPLEQSAAGDINGDGKLDLIFTYYGDNDCSSGSTVPPGFLIVLGNGDGTFKTPTFLTSIDLLPGQPSVGLPTAIALARFHGNSSPLDLVANLEYNQSGLYLFQGKGNGSFGMPALITEEFNVSQILSDDFNQDGKADLTLIGENTTNGAGVSLLTGNGDGTFNEPVSLAQGAASAGLYADVNGDGIPDFIDNVDYSLLSVYLGTGHGSFASPISYFLDSESGPIVAGKFLGGNALSLLAPISYEGGTALFMNQGGSILTAKASTTSIAAGQSLTLSSTMTPTLTGQPRPTGTITFYDGVTAIGSTSVDGSLSTNKLAVGTHTITAKYSGDAHFNPNAASPVSVIVVAAVASIQVSPTSIAFPNTTVGTTSAAHTVTIKNAGTTTVTFSSIKPGGTNYAEFLTTTTTCASTLAPGASCSASVAYKPQNTGAASAIYNVSDNIAGSPQKVTLSGTGVAPLTISVSPASLTFPTTKVGATSSSQTVTVKNTGTASVTFSSIKPGGTNYAEFLTTATTCGASLAGGASCMASVAFRPQATGAASATYNASDNALNSPQKVSLTGTGTE